MEKALLFVWMVLIGLCYAETAEREPKPEPSKCLDVARDHLAYCGHGKVCVWNKCHCRAGKPWCYLQCSSDPRKKCNGLYKGAPCSKSKHSSATCEKAGKLVCVPSPGKEPRRYTTTPKTTAKTTTKTTATTVATTIPPR